MRVQLIGDGGAGQQRGLPRVYRKQVTKIYGACYAIMRRRYISFLGYIAVRNHSAKLLPYRKEDRDVRAQKLRARFEAVSRKCFKPRPLYLRYKYALACGVLVVLLLLAAVSFYLPPASDSWSQSEVLRHLAAAPNCDAARAVGLAPARYGQPGYWPSHDADNDGIACEPWAGRWGIRSFRFGNHDFPELRRGYGLH